MHYNDMCNWSRDFDILGNRIAIVNQLLGYGVDGNVENPCRIRYSHGAYDVLWDGSPLCSFGVWDATGIASALRVVDAWADCLWRVGCLGLLSPVVR